MTKWIVLVAVLVITGIMATFSAQLTAVQNNEASSWLPESAESTQVLEELSETVDPNDIPTLVVYHRDGGLTEDDLAQLEADGQEIAELDGVTDAGRAHARRRRAGRRGQGAPVPTLVSEDGEVAYLYFVLNFGTDGWNAIPDAADEIRDIADARRRRGPPRRLRRPGRRLRRGVRGHRHQPDLRDARASSS